MSSKFKKNCSKIIYLTATPVNNNKVIMYDENEDKPENELKS